MNQHTHDNSGNWVEGFVVGLLVGGLSGSGVMLLLAPQSGKKMRAQIQRSSSELRDRMGKSVKSAVAQTRSKARQITNDVHEQAEDLQQRGQTVIDEQRDNLSQTLKDLGKAVQA